MLPFLLLLTLALAHGFEEEDGCADRHIEAVEPAQHGNAYVRIGCLAPHIGQTCGFWAHHDGCALLHGCGVIEARILQLGSEYLYVALLEEADAVL